MKLFKNLDDTLFHNVFDRTFPPTQYKQKKKNKNEANDVKKWNIVLYKYPNFSRFLDNATILRQVTINKMHYVWSREHFA